MLGIPITIYIVINNVTKIVHQHTRRDQDQDQDQDSLLVKRRNDNHSPGPVIRELVPSSHQRSGEDIPIPDSLGEEATFINICISNGSLKCHRVLISTTPGFGVKIICWYTGFIFKTLYSNVSLLLSSFS